MDVWQRDEQREVAAAVARLASDFGHDYFVARAREGKPATELWDAVAGSGFAGVSIPERYGGGGMGIAELSVVIEELAAQGCPAAGGCRSGCRTTPTVRRRGPAASRLPPCACRARRYSWSR